MVPLKSGILHLKVNEMQKGNINLSQKKTINIQHVIINTFRILVKSMNMITWDHYAFEMCLEM